MPEPSDLHFPHAAPPANGTTLEVAPGVLWLRLALPFQLNHVNVWLIEDGAGWAVVDTGVNDAPTRAAWEALLAGPLAVRKVTRLIVTHFHPDHVGLARFLAERCGAPLSMSRTEFLLAHTMQSGQKALRSASHRDFYARRCLGEAETEALIGRGHAYLDLTSGMPASLHRLRAGDTLSLGGRRFEVLTGGGHAPEQVMLLCREESLFLSADQVLSRISPNISVWPWEPDADPLGDYLGSLAALRASVPAEALVLPGHDLPFLGLHARLSQLERHHAQRCEEILDACRSAPRSAAELIPLLFRRPLDPQQAGFAFSEVVAHVNHLLRLGALAAEEADGRERLRAA